MDVFWAPLGTSWAFRRGETLLSNRNERGAQAKRTFGPCGILRGTRGTPLGVLCVSFCRAVVRIGVLFEMSVSSRPNAHFEASCDPWAPMGALCLTVGSKFTAYLQGFREMAKNNRNFTLTCLFFFSLVCSPPTSREDAIRTPEVKKNALPVLCLPRFAFSG